MPSRLPALMLALAPALLLGSCASSPQTLIDAARSGDPERVARVVLRDELSRRGLPQDVALNEIETLSVLLGAVRELLRERWGEPEPEVASERRYVKYTNAYEARAIIDFEQGWLRVETVAEEEALEKLRAAIVTTLLTPRDMAIEDIFTDAEPTPDGDPFLLGQILDADGEPIRWQWRAERFADHLIATALEQSRREERTVTAVTADLVDNHLHLRQLEYANEVIAAARQYGLDPALIYAVIEVESAFNPYAVSSANAYGLMQVVPATAGRDVFERIKRQPGQPSRQQLFQPAFNIDIGTAYLHLLDDHYLRQVSHEESRRLAIIAAYNGGPGSTLRTFHADRSRAIQRINGMSPQQVYQQLVSAHPFGETRRYVTKVRNAETRYQ